MVCDAHPTRLIHDQPPRPMDHLLTPANNLATIAKRELMSLFFSPIAYVVWGLFGLGAGLIFLAGFGPGYEAWMRPTYYGVVWAMIFLAPAISMRLISEEFRAGTIELLITAPVTDTHVVLGKWLGAWAFFGFLLLPLVGLIGVLEVYADPDYGPIFTGLFGLMLVGGLYLAIGVFASAVTQNQIISFLLTVFIICLFTVVVRMLTQAAFLSQSLKQVMYYLNVSWQFEDFGRGVINTSNCVYFISGIALFLFLAVKALERRRWW